MSDDHDRTGWSDAEGLARWFFGGTPPPDYADDDPWSSPRSEAGHEGPADPA